MDSIGKFKPLPQGYYYPLIVVEMLMNYKLGESHNILSDNATEFKNKLFVKVTSTLGKKQVF